MKVYLAGPITEARQDRKDWRENTALQLSLDKIESLLPRPLHRYREQYGIGPEDASTVLTVRDHKFCTESDVVLANFEGSVKPSIGTCIELGWASQAGTTIVAVIPEGNVHEHPMVLNVSNFRVHTLDEGIRTVLALAGERF